MSIVRNIVRKVQTITNYIQAVKQKNFDEDRLLESYARKHAII